jgi:hypothetical protein
MIRSKKRKTPAPSHWWNGIISLVGCVVPSGVVVGHNLPTSGSPQVPQLPTAPRVLLKAQFTPAYQPQTGEPQAAAESRPVAFRTADSEPAITPTGARLITHEEAQEKAAPANNAITRLGQLQVEVARQTRLGTLSTFFPPRGSTFSNMRFNKRMGKEIQFTGPLRNARSLAAPLLG